MTPIATLTFLPVWAVSFAVGLLALRLGRARGRGLVWLCLTQTLWLTGLLLLVTPSTAALGERLLPLGLLQPAGFVHAAADLEASGGARSRWVRAGWLVAGAGAVVGGLAPWLLVAPGLASTGPLFVPMAVVCGLVCAALLGWLGRCARASEGRERRRFVALAAAVVLGTAGGGGTLALVVLGLGSVWAAALPMLGSTLLAAFAVLDREQGRAQRLVVTGLLYATLTAVVSAVGLTAYALALPRLVPATDSRLALVGWSALVTFFATLPLDPLRQLVVEVLGRRLARDPIGVSDLADAVERSEQRADHAASLATLGQLVGAVAHEIRNPLGVLLVQARLLEKSGAPPARVQVIREQVARAQQFVDSLLRYGKPRPLALARVALRPVVERAVEQATASAASGAAGEPTVEVTGDTSLEAEVDASAIGDVVVVLVSNALAALADAARPEASGPGRITVRIEATDASARAVRLSVDDDGPGVDPALAATLFEPFVTGRGRDARHPGTGLGLAIARRWVERHGGTIAHERSGLGGARFVVVLPTHARLVAESPPGNDVPTA